MPHPKIDSLTPIYHSLRLPGLRRRPILDKYTIHHIALNVIAATSLHKASKDKNIPFGKGYRMPPPKKEHPAYSTWSRRADFQLELTFHQLNQAKRGTASRAIQHRYAPQDDYTIILSDEPEISAQSGEKTKTRCYFGCTVTSARSTTTSGLQVETWHTYQRADGFAPIGALLC